MNFEQALLSVFAGQKIRLSDWLGFWFIPLDIMEVSEGHVSIDHICVFTRDGDILNTANFERYKDRDDWEVVSETGWSFDMALRFLKNGKCIERAGWNGKGLWVRMIKGNVSIDSQVIGYRRTSFLEIKSINDTLTPWVPSQTDLLANDWQIVNL